MIEQYPLFLKNNNVIHTAKNFTQNITGSIIDAEPNLITKEKKIQQNDNIKYICLGISASGPTKRWDINNYIKLADQISKKLECKFYLAGGMDDLDLINKFKDSTIAKSIVSFDSLKIKETLKYISSCDLYIGNDTGWAHLAVALNVKALTLFCDSPVAAYGSYSSKMITIEPVGLQKGTTTHNTLGKDKISFEEVYNKSMQLLS